MRTPFCIACGSENVLKDAYAEWDNEKQKWVLFHTYDDSYCQDCDSEDILEWKDTLK